MQYRFSNDHLSNKGVDCIQVDLDDYIVGLHSYQVGMQSSFSFTHPTPSTSLCARLFYPPDGVHVSILIK